MSQAGLSAHAHAGLTTHVLDTANGKPASGIVVTLYRLEQGRRELLKSTITNSDGRTNEPLIARGNLEVGRYELIFEVGNYFGLPEPRFLETIPICFGIADVTAHYHVPLLVSPWAYSTYRGS
jgi:5-hydroxyisourate hydrolase